MIFFKQLEESYISLLPVVYIVRNIHDLDDLLVLCYGKSVFKILSIDCFLEADFNIFIKNIKICFQKTNLQAWMFPAAVSFKDWVLPCY